MVMNESILSFNCTVLVKTMEQLFQTHALNMSVLPAKNVAVFTFIFLKVTIKATNPQIIRLLLWSV